jgi:hypothetical protein
MSCAFIVPAKEIKKKKIKPFRIFIKANSLCFKILD